LLDLNVSREGRFTIDHCFQGTPVLGGNNSGLHRLRFYRNAPEGLWFGRSRNGYICRPDKKKPRVSA